MSTDSDFEACLAQVWQRCLWPPRVSSHVLERPLPGSSGSRPREAPDVWCPDIAFLRAKNSPKLCPKIAFLRGFQPDPCPDIAFSRASWEPERHFFLATMAQAASVVLGHFQSNPCGIWVLVSVDAVLCEPVRFFEAILTYCRRFFDRNTWHPCPK